jgi:GH18 family chitinase
LAAAYSPNDSGKGRGVWNQTAAAQLDKASTWTGDVTSYTLTSPKTVRHKVAWAKRMGLGGIYVWNLQDDLCVPDLAPAGIMLEAAAKTKIFNAEKLLQLLVVNQQQNGDDNGDLRDEL